LKETIDNLVKMENSSNGVSVEQGIVSQTKRSPLGIALVAGPFNYPLNVISSVSRVFAKHHLDRSLRLCSFLLSSWETRTIFVLLMIDGVEGLTRNAGV
jgi:hypothetical protein